MKIIAKISKGLIVILLSLFVLSFLLPNKNPVERQEIKKPFSSKILSCGPLNDSLEEITINENRQPAGEIRQGIYYLNLEIREGYWYPDSKEGAPIRIKAFAESGKPLQVPGPLIRVPEGTEMKISVRNKVKGTVRLFGFTARLYRPDYYKESAIINEGETKVVSFNSGKPGTFLYTAKHITDSLTPETVQTPFFNSQLYGAFIVDSAIKKINSRERIFMVGICGVGSNKEDILPKYVINGLAWPYTERLSYTLGEKVDWRIINASVLGHPMHLHGFPFVISSIVFPSAAKDSVIPEEKRKPVVTQNLIPMNRMRISWVPGKEGNWLFHCHLLDHTLPAAYYSSDGQESHNHMATQSHARTGMGGLILGIQVQPKKKFENKQQNKTITERKLTLLIGDQPNNNSGDKNGKGFQLIEGAVSSTTKYSIPGPPIILTKNQPVSIKVINNLKEATTMHWHGLILDSYYDGVAGWGNDGKKLAPLIQPGDSFVVHLTPTQTGTFMYHTHMHNKQILEGLYGPLIIMELGEKYDPEIDKIFLMSQGGANIQFTKDWMNGFTNLKYLLNGNNKPDTLYLKKGITYRIHVINISAQQNSYFATPRAGFDISLKKDNKPISWKVTGKDGYMYPMKQREMAAANNQRAAPGTTHDFEFTANAIGDYRFNATMDEEIVITQIIKVRE